MNVNSLRIFNYVLLITISLTSCISVLPVISPSGKDVTERGGTDFVEMKDGSFIDGVIDKDNLWEVIFKKESGSLTISGKKIANKDIAAFQDDNKYYRKNISNFFCKRIVKGGINVYGKQGDGGSMEKSFSYTLFYLQKGTNEKVVYFSKKVLQSMVSDFPPAAHWLEEGIFKKKNQDWYFNKAISTYNEK